MNVTYLTLSCPISVSSLVYKLVMLSTMHTHHHLLQWPSSSKPIEEERTFTLKGISIPRSEMVQMASNSGDAIQQTYNRVFMLLKDKAVVLGLSFDPLVIVSDFELAMVQASTMSFSNSYHRGCYYHFMQAIWRKVCSQVLL